MKAQLSPSAKAVPHSRIRELAEIAMGMDGVLKLYFGESNVPTPEYIKRAAQNAYSGEGDHDSWLNAIMIPG